jgi:N-acetylmuramoyl-L-alanine amidase
MAWAKAHCWARARSLAAMAIGVMCAWPALAEAPAVAVRLGLRGASTRVVIDSAAPISVAPATARDGRIEFTVTGLTPPQDLRGDGLGVVRSWRLQAGEGGSSLTLDMAAPGAAVHHFLIPPGPDSTHYRYVIDVGAPETVASAAATPQVVPPVAVAKLSVRRHVREVVMVDAGHGSHDPGAQSAPVTVASAVGTPEVVRPVGMARLSARRHVREVVVIDAGHGGHDPGAQSADANEKDITLATALALRERLERGGRYRVVMTRSTDVFVPLEERVRIARRAGADLFIALHADSAGADAKAHGASVYTLSDHGETRVGEVLGAHEWFSHAATRSDPAVNGILLDLTQRSTLNRSSMFAQELIDSLSAKIDMLPNSHRDAGYFVLLAPDVPAVLLEMGFITCPADEARLTDPAQRRQLVDAVGDAIDAYFAGEVRVAER